jgi:hypothetical protein
MYRSIATPVGKYHHNMRRVKNSRNKFPLGEASPGFILILNPPFCPLFLPLLTTATQLLIPIIFTILHSYKDYFSPRTTFSLHFCPHPSITLFRHKQQWQWQLPWQPPHSPLHQHTPHNTINSLSRPIMIFSRL